MENKDTNQKSETTPTISAPPSGFKVILREFRKDKIAMISVIIAASIILASIIGSMVFKTSSVMTVNIMEQYAHPGVDGFVLGADEGGRDVMKLLFIGARNSIAIGVSVAILIEFIGLVVGLVAGYFGGIVDSIIMRIVDFFMILPTFLLIIVLVTIVPRYNAVTLVLIMSFLSWMTTARLMRSLVLSQNRREYIMASRTSGTSNFKIMFRELLPNISSMIIIDLTLTIASSIGLETGLTFLGFGLPASTPSLGTLIGYANNPETITNRMWVWLPAALVLLAISLSINYIGKALGRAADARQRLG